MLIEGNIGVGKSTVFEHFRKLSDVCICVEPVELWQNLNGHNILELMYKEGEKWAFPFQSYATLTMLQTHNTQTTKRIKMMERSLFSGRYCFTEAMLANNVLHKAMYDVMLEWYKFISANIHIQTDLIVYLRTTPEVVYERMKSRGRSEESAISLDYLKQLHKLHEDWLIRGHNHQPAPVFILNADLDEDKIASEYVRLEHKIKECK